MPQPSEPEPLSTEPKFLPDPAQIAHLREILRSNSLPPETTHFRHVVEIAPAEIARYDSEIERLRVVLEQLVADRATLHAYADGCRSIVAPIRRLPQVLVQIFWLVPPAASDVLSDTTTYAEELGRLAKEELLALSNVCSHWHGVVMNTPMLWSTIVTDTDLWNVPETMAYLLSQSLEPLWTGTSVRQAVKLLAQHSQRWRDCMGFLSQARGNLPALETLDITATNWTEVIDAFAVKFEGPPSLKSFTCTQMHEADFQDYLYLARQLPRTADAFLPLDMQSTLSEVYTFMLRIRVAEDEEHAKQVLGGIFGCLALPYTHHLLLEPRRSLASPPLSWSHAEFLTLASRSSFHETLTTLSLSRVLIMDDELLECLSVVPLLQQLDLQDYHESDVYEIPDHAIITDKLLHGLIPTDNDHCLVPHLIYLGFTYLSFIRSRLDLGRDRRPPFEISLRWIPGHKRELAPECALQLSELVQQGDLIFAFEQDADW
ncbi:hypothetical protein C8J57DRAFT_1363384 [Mycena rebaudengoi]|nr:hypothetical protein C8J57DRAFT_1363384 [Mycena rebaudengoi]